MSNGVPNLSGEASTNTTVLVVDDDLELRRAGLASQPVPAQPEGSVKGNG